MLKNIEPYKLPDGTYDCDINFTQEDWLKVLKSEKCAMTYIATLAVFLRCEGHKSTCTDAAKSSKVSSSSSIRNKVTHFGQIAQDVINRVEIRREDDSNIFWLFPMTGKELKGGLFEWKLRDELAYALRQYIKGLQKAFIREYPKDSLPNLPIQEYTNLEKTSFCYKLEFGLDILGGVSGSTAFKFGIYKAKNSPKMNDGVRFEDGYAWQERFGDTYRKAYNSVRKNVAEIAELASKEKFEAIEEIDLAETIKWKIAYLYSNRKIVPIFNIDMLSKAAEAWGMDDAFDASYTDLQKYVLSHQEEDEDDLEFYYRVLRSTDYDSETEDEEDSEDSINFYLAGFIFNDGGDQLPRFIDDGIWEGSGPKSVNKLIEDIRKDDIIILKSTSTKGPKHDQPFLRVYGAMKVLSERPEKTGSNYRVNTEYIPVPQKDFDGNKFGRYRQTVHVCDNEEIIEYVNQFLNCDSKATPIMDCSKYIDQLKRSHNLILTGAPGTGKTYLAKAMAEQMGSEWAMVQFHPSYDYTDFVEGIRPTKDHGFERTDGAFKDFCKKALKNLADSQKSVTVLSQEKSLEDALEDIVNDAIDNEAKFETPTHKHAFYIVENRDSNIIVRQTMSKDNESRISVSKHHIYTLFNSGRDLESMTLKDVRSLFNGTRVQQSDTYALAFAEILKDKYTPSATTTIQAVKKKDFVFIIDEINRGEISKIFGELFFSIDPGYRGTAGRIETQYQNLIDADDEFAKGFYVPENVYILGTMNDIDRSVESMDFAIRRRFAWREILPEERKAMWDGRIDAFKEEAEERMDSLNQVISDPANGLGPEYCIGPAYFLHLAKGEYNGDFDKLWEYNLKGVLSEYLRGNRDASRIMSYFQKAYNLEDSETEAGNTDN